jgi:hypothetical protein
MEGGRPSGDLGAHELPASDIHVRGARQLKGEPVPA